MAKGNPNHDNKGKFSSSNSGSAKKEKLGKMVEHFDGYALVNHRGTSHGVTILPQGKEWVGRVRGQVQAKGNSPQAVAKELANKHDLKINWK